MRRLEEDMRVAAEIQRGLLPGDAPIVPGYGLVGSNRPCRTVGGDYYDFALRAGPAHARPRRRVREGHGGGAAHDRAAGGGARPTGARPRWRTRCRRINSTVCQNVTAGKYITFFMARLDPATGGMSTTSTPGHNPPILVRKNGAIENLTEGGMVLGLFDSMPYEEGEAELRLRRHPPHLLGRRDRDLERQGDRSSARSGWARWRGADVGLRRRRACRRRSCASWTCSPPAPRPPTTARSSSSSGNKPPRNSSWDEWARPGTS